MNYQTILKIKESEKATIELAAVEMFVGPVIVKKLKGGKPDIYRLLTETSHPNVSKIISVEETQEGLFVVEEYVDGENLAEHLQKHYLSDDEKINLALQLCDAVGFLHAMKPSVIHRDIKPSNILINKKMELKLIDFDASRQYKDAPSSSDTRLLGTVEYAPPEQFGYAQTDVRSDIYSMGVVFHEMRPTENKKLVELWEKISEKCTSFDPKNRYQSVAELKREFEKLAVWKKKKKSKIIAGACGGALILAAATAAIFLWPKKSPAGADGVPTSTPTTAPAATATNAPTDTPTSPTAKPENTPVPTMAAVSDERRDTAEIVAELKARKAYIDTFYKGMDTSRDFMQYSTLYEGETVRFWSVSMCCLNTGKVFQVPSEYVYNENNVLHIKNSYLQGLDEGCYRMNVEYMDEATGRTGSMTTHLLIYAGAEAGPEALLCDNNYLDFYYEYDTCVHTILANDIDGCFKASDDYTVLENGRVLEISRDFLLQRIEPGTSGKLYLTLELEDGRKERITVAYLAGTPPYAK